LTYVRNSKEVTQMPARDGTGPLGRGPLTGRGLGNCADNGFSGNNFGFYRRGYRRNLGFGRGGGFGGGGGFGLGRGGGFGRGFGLGRFIADDSGNGTLDRETLADLKKQLESQLEAVNKQLEDL
jgi:hypothetical protein